MATAPAVTLSPTSLGFGSTARRHDERRADVTLTKLGQRGRSRSLASASPGRTRRLRADEQLPGQPGDARGRRDAARSPSPSRPSATGAAAASVSITDNAAGSPQTVALSGTGTAPAVDADAGEPRASRHQLDRHDEPGADLDADATPGTAPMMISSIVHDRDERGDFAQTERLPAEPGDARAATPAARSPSPSLPARTGARTASVIDHATTLRQPAQPSR